MASSLQIRPYEPADWPAVWALLEPVFRAGETFPHDPAISEAEAQLAEGEPSQGASLAALLDRFPLVTRAAEAVVARGIETQRAASAAFLDGAAGVAPGAGHAVAARAVVTKRAASNLGQRLHRLLG